MKVDKIQYQSFNSKQTPQKNTTNLSFKAGKPLNDMITDTLKHKKILKFLEKLEWLKGESGTILITAIGTGCIAPIFIAYNPFVRAKKGATKEEKKEVRNTKYYTAMRQPISAILAIIIQLGLLKPIDTVLNNIVNKEKYSKNFRLDIDQCELNSKKFIEDTMVKQEFKQKNIKKPSIFNIFKDGFKKYNADKENYDQLVKNRVDEIRNGQLTKIADKFQKTGKINIGSRYLEHSQVASLINKQIDDYIDDALALKVDKKGLEYYSNKAEVLIKNEERIREIFKKVPKDDDIAGMKTFLENQLKKEQNEDVKKVLQKLVDMDGEVQGNHIKRILSRIAKIKEMCNGNYSKETYLEAMEKKNIALDEIIEKLKSNKIKDTKNATQETIVDTIKKITTSCSFDAKDKILESTLHDTTTFNHNTDKLTKKIYKDVTKKYKEFLENGYKSFNQPLKVLIGVLITLPITCNLLNWVYPRVMDLVFPKLSGAKAAKEGGNK